MVAILSSPKGPEFQVYKLLNPNKSDPVTYCSIISKLTKVVQINEHKNNFFKFNIWLKKRVSKIINNIKNLMSIKDLKIGLFSNDISFNLTFNISTLRKWIVVDIKKYEKKIIKIQFKLLNLKDSRFFLIKKREKTINSNVFMLTAKFPSINHRGKV